MNYRHSYHAGGFSDVFKHVILVALIQALSRKEKPFCYLETHAGAGLYDLRSEPAQKTQEYMEGIEKIISILAKNDLVKNIADKNMEKIPDLIAQYASIVKGFQYPHYYPGSPSFAKKLLRDTDQMILMEYHPEEYQCLKEIMKDRLNNLGSATVGVHHRDGYDGLKAFLPPVMRRGLILIDPPYEKPSEWQDLLQAVARSLKKFPTGVYAIWYPIKDQKSVKTFTEELSKLTVEEMLIAEFNIYPLDTSFSLIGCGMAILNPPYKLETELQSVVSWLWQALSKNGAGNYRVEQL